MDLDINQVCLCKLQALSTLLVMELDLTLPYQPIQMEYYQVLVLLLVVLVILLEILWESLHHLLVLDNNLDLEHYSIDAISATDTLYLTDVQGQTFSNNAALLHFNGTNFVALTGNKQVDGTVNTPIDALHDGNVIEVSHYNHGMHSGNNKLEISNIQPYTTCCIKCSSWIIHKCIYLMILQVVQMQHYHLLNLKVNL